MLRFSTAVKWCKISSINTRNPKPWFQESRCLSLVLAAVQRDRRLAPARSTCEAAGSPAFFSVKEAFMMSGCGFGVASVRFGHGGIESTCGVSVGSS